MDINITIADLLKTLADNDAGLVQLTARKGDDEIVFSIIALRGEGTQEILDAINEIYDRQFQEEIGKLAER